MLPDCLQVSRCSVFSYCVGWEWEVYSLYKMRKMCGWPSVSRHCTNQEQLMNKVGIGSCLGLFFLSLLLIMLLELISFCKDSDTVKPHWFQWCPERVLTTKVKCSMSCLIFKNLNQMKKRRKAGSNDLIDLISELSLFSLVASHSSRYFF